MTQNSQHQFGFTLLELVISLTIMVVLMGLAYSSLMQIATSKDALEDGQEVSVIAAAVLTRLTRELQLAYGQDPLMPPKDSLTTPYPAMTRLISKDGRDSEGNSGASLTFLAREAGQYLPDGSTNSGSVQITYRIEKAPSEEKIDTLYLVRDEVPYQRPFEKAYKKLMTFPITKNVVSLRFRFYNVADEQWSDTWGDDKHTGLPNLIEFTLTLRTPMGNDRTYSSAVALRSK